MNVFIPAALEKSALEFGEEGTRWLQSLPERIAALAEEWACRIGPALDHGGCVSWVAPVEREDGTQAILKVGIPHDEARYEAEALRFLAGQGAARLLRVSDDGFSMLLERCLPGTDLWSLGEEEGDAVACAVLRRLWREPPANAPFLPLSDLMAHWADEIPRIATDGGYDWELAAEAVAFGRELAASQPQRVFLHGDFHPGNVLAAQREPWLVIDPKPLIGDPAYDLAQWLANRYDAAILTTDPVSLLRRQTERFADNLGLDPARIAGWTFVKAFGWEWGPEATTLFHKVMKT